MISIRRAPPLFALFALLLLAVGWQTRLGKGLWTWAKGEVSTWTTWVAGDSNGEVGGERTWDDFMHYPVF